MFVGVARLELRIAEAGSLKSKRQVVRQVVDRLKSKFNVSVAEVGDQAFWQRALIGVSVVGGERRHVEEQLEKAIRFVEDMYVAPLISRQSEIMALGEQLYGGPSTQEPFPIDRGERSLAEAEGLEPWEARGPESEDPAPSEPEQPPLAEARVRARTLRRPREWEQK
ncbi:MAG: DUF503 domain-containing protein [Myxococcaceae bacterium]